MDLETHRRTLILFYPTKLNWFFGLYLTVISQKVPKYVKFWKKLLTAGLQIARRGRCFNNYVANLNNLNTKKKYKLYLSFENGYHCKDYISEKLFRNSYLMGAVPIVWGANKSDYEALGPPNSYIYIEDFNTLDDLVKYVNYLDKNDTAYREYFKWRTKDVTDMPQYGRGIAKCQLC